MDHVAMGLDSGASLGQLIMAIGVILCTGGIAWGSISQRVRSLEREVEALSGLTERLTRIEEQTKFIGAEIGKVTASWLFREPPGYDQIERPIEPRSAPRRQK